MATKMTVEQFQQFMQHLIPTIQNQFLQQTKQQQPGDGATTVTPLGRKVTIHPKCYSRLDKFAGGERVVLRLSQGHGHPECDGVRDVELDRGEWGAHLQGDHDGS